MIHHCCLQIIIIFIWRQICESSTIRTFRCKSVGTFRSKSSVGTFRSKSSVGTFWRKSSSGGSGLAGFSSTNGNLKILYRWPSNCKSSLHQFLIDFKQLIWYVVTSQTIQLDLLLIKMLLSNFFGYLFIFGQLFVYI